ncbi:MAG: cytochrome c peroxidase [Nannocystaceae bacterium]
MVTLGFAVVAGCGLSGRADDAAERADEGMLKIRGVALGECMRRSGSVVVGSGYEVYQSSCDGDTPGLWWRQECAGGYCRFINDGEVSYCLKASETHQASGGSYDVYAAPCSGDLDQQWIVHDRDGGEVQLENRETVGCAHTTQSEQTPHGFLQVVRRECSSSDKQRFVLEADDDTIIEDPAAPPPVLTPGTFSTPSPAVYSRIDRRPRAFARHIDTGFGGNGHAQTWDGRIFVVRRSPGGNGGWFASAFRPETITLDDDGIPSFSSAWGDQVILESDDDEPALAHNWLAISPDPEAGIDNPYRSDGSGAPDPSGTHQTYEALVYSTNERGQGGFGSDFRSIGLRKAQFIVADAHTPQAQLVTAEMTSEWTPLEVEGTSDGLDCIEPTLTFDARMIICQGHPDNNGSIDRLVYSWTDQPGSRTGWKRPRNLSQMHEVKDELVDGMPFGMRYPIAQQPIKDQRGIEYGPDEQMKGAYPWVSRDGSELFYQSSREGVSARRSATTVVGRWTGWATRHIDGPTNFDIGTSKLFLSSPGAFTTMWTPYPDLPELAIPYSVRGPSYPLFHSNKEDYSEVGFDDYLDGNYVVYFGMNQQIAREGEYQQDTTNDTSGHFNNGTLEGARFPLQHNDRDEIVGRHGQAIYFPANAHITVARNDGWDSLTEGLSVDMFVRRLEAQSEVVPLFELADGIRLYLNEQGRLAARIEDTEGRSATVVAASGPALVSSSWVHVAMTYEPATQALTLYVDGREEATSVADIGTLRTSGAVVVGPKGASPGLLLLDEVKVSNVARQPYEIRHLANVPSNPGPSPQLEAAVPEHLRGLLRYAADVDGFSEAAAALGEDLFSAELLSNTNTTSCASCHVAELGFTDALPIAASNEPAAPPGIRNTPTIFNRLLSSFQGWSGASDTLAAQSLVPIAAAHEMNLSLDVAVERLRNEADWSARFVGVFGEEPTQSNLAAAFASFQALQFSPSTVVDRYLAGDVAALSESERRGLLLFRGKARCGGCHAGPNFTDESFRNTGLVDNGDEGRADQTGRDRDVQLFKVPTLRAVGATAPYMHDGSFATLREVLDGYNLGGLVPGSPVDTDIRPLELTEPELQDLEAFLQAL